MCYFLADNMRPGYGNAGLKSLAVGYDTACQSFFTSIVTAASWDFLKGQSYTVPM